MGFLDALKKRSSAVRFGFSFRLHFLSPWPATDRAVAVAWQRGSKKKKRGVTDAHRPKQVQGQEGNVAPTPSGPFKKKCLILAIIEGGNHGRDTSALGRVVIDLAEFASMQNEVEKEFPVACNRTIVAAVGDPRLRATVNCMWKSSGGPASRASSMSSDRTGGTFTTNFNAFIRGEENEQIPVRLTGEQFDDLRGFERLNTIKETDHDLREKSSKGFGRLHAQNSDSIPPEYLITSPHREQGDDETPAERSGLELNEARLKHHERQTSRDITLPGSDAPSGDVEEGPLGPIEASQDRTGEWLSGLNVSLAPQTSTPGLIYQLSDDMPIPLELQQLQQDASKSQVNSEAIQEEDGRESISTVSPALDRLTDAGSELLSSMELFGLDTKAKDSEKGSDRSKEIENRSPSDERLLPSEEKASSSVKQMKETASPRPSKTLNLERRWRRVTNLSDENDDKQSPRPPMPPKMPSPSPDRPASPLSRTSLSQKDGSLPTSMLMSELRSATFLEYAVYLARPGSHKYTSRNVHAPARRISRGLNVISNDGEEAFSLLQSCLHAIRATVESCGTDVTGLAFWWGNCFQLRVLMTRLDIDRLSTGSESGEWFVRRMQQLVLKMEKGIFDRLQQYLWWKVFVPYVASTAQDIKPSPYNEGGVLIWLSALDAVCEQFALSNLNGDEEMGHLRTLRRKIIGNCCRMMDAMLFRELLSGVTQGPAFYNTLNSFHGDLVSSQPRIWPKVQLAALPFKKGPLTFGVGMHLKMAVTRWSQWAIESNMKEPTHTGDPGQSFFPSLKASADLLMMPKELLTDASVRDELFAALSIRSMCILLEKFQPDEFAPDPVDPDVLNSLRERLDDIHEADQSVQLQEPPFDVRSDAVDIEGRIDAESEDELDTFIKSFPPNDDAISRFELLKTQWLIQRR